MTPRRPEVVSVRVDLPQFEVPALMGTLRCQSSRTGDILSFAYDDAWLKRPAAFTFDPDLALVTGPQYPGPDRANFGIFLDSFADRSGRILMQKRENMRARQQARKARSLTECGISCSGFTTRPGWARSASETRIPSDSSTVTIRLRRRLSRRYGIFRPRALSSKSTRMMKSILSINGGSRNYLLQEHLWVAHAPRHLSKTKTAPSVED